MPQIIVKAFKADRQEDQNPLSLYFSRVNKEVLANPDSSDYDIAREVRKDPTCALARAFFLAPILTANWTIEANKEKHKKVLEQALVLKGEVHKTAARSCLDYGWQAWEAVPYVREGGVWRIKARALKHDITSFYLQGGEIAGVVNGATPFTTSGTVNLPLSEMFAVSTMAEYDNPYGEAVTPQASPWVIAGELAEEEWARYGSKIAGSHWVIKYPIGSTPLLQANGEVVDTPNEEIVQTIIETLKSSSIVALPVDKDITQVRAQMRTDNSTEGAWDVKLITDHGNAADVFSMRERAININKMRAFWLPERSVTEGASNTGTKSDSVSAGDAALQVIESWSEDLMQSMNGPRGLVRLLFEVNDIEWYEGIASIKQSPLKDADRAFMRELIRTVVNNVGAADTLNLEEVARRADIPLRFGEIDVKRLGEQRATGQQAGQQPPQEGGQPPRPVNAPGTPGAGNTPTPGGPNPNTN